MTRKTAFLFLALAAALLLSSSDALAARIRCKTAFCEGTEQADVISGRLSADQIVGKGGNDEITGRSGNDILSGQAGNDLIFGESGNDTISGGSNDDRLFGGDGRDSLSGDGEDDFIDATFGESFPEQDTVTCGEGVDTVVADRLDKVASDCERVTRV